ncbi:MAG: 23S rRNA (guanosine(2251)-2'-O)-methyltransferase RlmB [Atribacterales bacterium]
MKEELIYGRQPVREALKSEKRKVKRLFVMEGAQGKIIEDIKQLSQKRKIPWEIKDKSFLEELVGKNVNHQGVVLLAQPRASLTWQEILKKNKTSPEATVVFVDRVEDPANLGTIARTAAFFGVGGILISKARSAPLDSPVVRASAGGIESIDIAQINNFTQVIKEFQKAGFWIVALEADGDKDIWDADLRGMPLGLVVGGEHEGIRRVVRSSCDMVLRIPSRGVINSLNVAVALGIGIYEVMRQRSTN